MRKTKLLFGLLLTMIAGNVWAGTDFSVYDGKIVHIICDTRVANNYLYQDTSNPTCYTSTTDQGESALWYIESAGTAKGYYSIRSVSNGRYIHTWSGQPHANGADNAGSYGSENSFYVESVGNATLNGVTADRWSFRGYCGYSNNNPDKSYYHNSGNKTNLAFWTKGDQASHWRVEIVDDADALAKIKGYDTTYPDAVKAGDVIRLTSTARIAEGRTVYDNGSALIQCQKPADTPESKELWYVEKAPYAHKYYLRNLATGLYLQSLNLKSGIWATAYGKNIVGTDLFIGKFPGSDLVNVCSVGSEWSYMNHSSSSPYTGSSSWTASDGPSKWAIEKITNHGIEDWNAYWASLTIPYTNLLPEEGKYYVIESAYSAFTDKSKHMCICTNGSTIGWKEYDASDLSFILKAEKVDGGSVQFKFFKDNKYVAPQLGQSVTYATQSEPNNLLLYINGQKGFLALQSEGSSYYFNPSGHNSGAGTSGNIVNWGNQFNASNEWILKEVDEPTAAIITYNLKKGGTTLWTTSVATEIGKPFPSVTVNPFIIIDGYPEGNVTGGGEYDLDWHCVVDYAASADKIAKWYAMDIRSYQNGTNYNYPLYGTSTAVHTGADNDDFRSGAVKNDNYQWGFITDNPCNNNFKIYNKGQQKYAEKASNGNGVEITLGTTGHNFEVFTAHSSIANSVAFKKVGDNAYWNEENHKGYIKGWHNNNDQGSSIRIFDVTPATVTDEVSYTMGADYGTLIVPFYAEIPEDAKVYTCSAINGNVLTLQEETSIIKPNTAYIIEGEEYSEWSFSNTSKLTTIPAMAATGIMVGTYNATTVGAIYSYAENNNVTAYVLTKVGGRAAFQYLDSEAAKTYATNAIDANRCVLIQPKGSSVKSTLFFDEETAINELNANSNANSNGKFLENGKIVIVKNNAKYNVAGQMIK